MTQLPFTKTPKKQLIDPLAETVKLANRRSDYVIYGLVIFFLLVPGLIIAHVSGEALITLFVGIGIILAGFIVVRLQQIMLLSNGMRLQNGSYEALSDDIKQFCLDLKMKPVDVLATQDPFMNAYAMGFARPYTIVLHSGTIEKLEYNELRAVLLHEIGHIKYRHTFLGQLLLPLQALPVIGQVSSWVINFWYRRNEYTADRLAVSYTGDPELVIRALIKIHVGPFIGEYLTKEQLMYQEALSRGMSRRFIQTFSSHPFLVNRIKAIIRFSDQQGYAMADDLRQFVRNSSKS